MRLGAKFGERILDVVIYSLLVLLIIVTLYPLIHVLFASISQSDRLMQHSGVLLRPLGINFDAYRAVLTNPLIQSGYRNTMFIVLAGGAVNLLMTIIGAYVLSRKRVLWNKFFIFTIIFTMFFNGGLIPLYMVVKGFGLIDSLWSIIIPSAISTFNLIIMRTAFQAIPDALEESAKIDGAGHLTILLRIVLPLSLPVLAVIALYYSVDKWNGWFYASIFLKDSGLFPLQLILRQILIANITGDMAGSGVGEQHQIGESIKYATIMVATIPILCVYPFLQRYFVKGVMIGALKG